MRSHRAPLTTASFLGQIRLWPMAACLILSGCFLPPPAEDRPLTGELDDAFHVDSTVAPAGPVLAGQSIEAGRTESIGADMLQPVGAGARPSGEATGEPTAHGAESGVAATDAIATPTAPSERARHDGAPGLEAQVVAPESEPGTDVSNESPEPLAKLNSAGADKTVTGVSGIAGGIVGGAGGSSLSDESDSSDPSEAPTAAGIGNQPEVLAEIGAPPETSIVVVQESPGSDLRPVVDATATVTGTEDKIDTLAVERDPDAAPPVGMPSELKPKALGSTVTADDANPVVDSPARVAKSTPTGDGQVPVGAGAEPTGAQHGEPSEAMLASLFETLKHSTDDGFEMLCERGGPTPTGPSTAGPSGHALPSAVVFIHGWCGNRSQWATHMEALVSDTTVISVDLLGHGESHGQGREEWTIPRYGRDVAGLIEAQGLKNVVIVGHAMGGQVALEVALRLPDRVVGVVGVESLHALNVSSDAKADPAGLDTYLEAFQNNFKKAFNDFVNSAAHRDTPALIRARIALDASGCDAEVAVKLMKHFQTRDLKKVVRTIECPVHCINSEVFTTTIEENQVLLPGFEATLMQGVGFWPHLELPEDFLSKLVAELKELAAPEVERVPAELTGLNPVLFSDDLAALEAFYVDGLRFKVVARLPIDQEQPASLVTLERDDLRLLLQARATLATDLAGVDGVVTGGQVLFLTVTDLADEQDRLGPGANVLIPRRKLESGSEQMVLRDPAQNIIVLQQPPRS